MRTDGLWQSKQKLLKKKARSHNHWYLIEKQCKTCFWRTLWASICFICHSIKYRWLPGLAFSFRQLSFALPKPVCPQAFVSLLRKQHWWDKSERTGTDVRQSENAKRRLETDAKKIWTEVKNFTVNEMILTNHYEIESNNFIISWLKKLPNVIKSLL